jgi:hypothetical protein
MGRLQAASYYLNRLTNKNSPVLSQEGLSRSEPAREVFYQKNKNLLEQPLAINHLYLN